MHQVKFVEEGHRYYNELDQDYISVTTLIGRYKIKFDTQYWSTYKAVKDTLESINMFKSFKIEAGGWQNVVAYWGDNPVHLDAVLDRKNYYIEKWRQEGITAAEKGTAEHLRREEALLAKSHITSKKNVHMPVRRSPIMEFDGESNGVFAEAVIWNDKYQVAGQVDLIEKEGIYLDIKDFKTNKKIDREGFMNAKMHHPLSDVTDSSYYHYQLQMSIYGWMAEQIGYKVRSLELIHVTEGGDISYDVEYMPGWVEKIMNHYDRRDIIETEECSSADYNYTSISTK